MLSYGPQKFGHLTNQITQFCEWSIIVSNFSNVSNFSDSPGMVSVKKKLNLNKIYYLWHLEYFFSVKAIWKFRYTRNIRYSSFWTCLVLFLNGCSKMTITLKRVWISASFLLVLWEYVLRSLDFFFQLKRIKWCWDMTLGSWPKNWTCLVLFFEWLQ